MIWAAILSAAGALGIASFTLFITAPWLRRELSHVEAELAICQQQRLEMRKQLQVIVSALVGLLPEGKRINLMLELDEHAGDEL